MELHCRRCRAEILEEDIDLLAATARCRACDTLFPLRIKLDDAPHALQRATVGLPERFSVEDKGDALLITFWSSRADALPMLLFAVPFLGVLSAMSALIVSNGAWFLAPFGLINVAFGGALAVNTAAKLFNSTQIRVDGARVELRSGPVPPRRRMQVAAAAIEQLYCTATKHKHGARRWRTYNVIMRTKGGRERVIVSDLGTDRQALFIEQQIEAWLRITDEPMLGELEK